MKQSKKELKELLKEQEARLEHLNYGYKELEDYKELQKQLVEIRSKLNSIEYNWHNENNDSKISCRQEISELEKMIKFKGELNPLDYSEKVKEIYNLFYRGFTSYKNRKLIWVSDDERFVLMQAPSVTEYVDRMTGSKSSPSEWYLIDSEKISGRSIMFKNEAGCIFHQEGGRWSKKFELKIKEVIQNYLT
jgi:hypothetical protein